MTNAPIRILIIFSIITLIGVISIQVYWANRAIDSQKRQFSHSVQIALRNVVEGVCEVNGIDVASTDPIEQVSDNYFIVRVDNKINVRSLEDLLQVELNKREINDDFEYGVYDCQNNQMVYGDLVSSGNEFRRTSNFPSLSENDYYFGVLFPKRAGYALLGTDLWKLTTGLTLLFIVFFGYTLFIILRQKRLSTIQRDFINNITHELKTPVSTLKVAASVLSNQDSLTPERLGQYSELISRESDRLEKHVQRILNAAVVENGHKMELSPIDISYKAKEIINHFREKYPEVEFKVSVESNVIFNCDMYYLETILYNILDNAVKYGKGQVSFILAEENGKITIRVIDNGEGIIDKEKKKVFRKFYRIPSGNLHEIKGFGIGLYSVKQALKRLGGSIEVLSNQGCEFKVMLQQ